VHREAELELDARNRRHALLALRHPPSTPAMLLHQEMVFIRAQWRDAIADRIAHHAWVDAWKTTMVGEASPSNAPAVGGDDDDDQFHSSL
jgi:hypothetical protein